MGISPLSGFWVLSVQIFRAEKGPGFKVKPADCPKLHHLVQSNVEFQEVVI